jgi:hypothetical protein
VNNAEIVAHEYSNEARERREIPEQRDLPFNPHRDHTEIDPPEIRFMRLVQIENQRNVVSRCERGEDAAQEKIDDKRRGRDDADLSAFAGTADLFVGGRH